MSQYGPPGGPYPGQPQDPWQSGQPQDPYGQQQDPYAQDPWGGSPSSAPPGSPGPYGSGGYGQTSNFPTSTGNFPPTQAGNYNQGGFDNQGGGYDPYGQQSQFVPPPKKRGSGVLITVVIVLAVLLCGGGAAGIYYVSQNKDDKKTTAGSGATDNPTNAGNGNSAGPSAGASKAPSDAATDNAGDAKDAQVGDCLINDGTSDKPVLRKTKCAAGTFEILKRFDSTSDVKKCDNVPGYSHNYFYKTKNESFSFVLCMKLR